MKNKPSQTLYSQMRRFADLTIHFFLTENIERAKHCLLSAENLFNTGSLEMKNALVNSYLYSVSTFLEAEHINIPQTLPLLLRKEYYKQVNSIGT